MEFLVIAKDKRDEFSKIYADQCSATKHDTFVNGI